MRILLFLLAIVSGLLYRPCLATALETTIVAEGEYVMGDGDTLAMAEERVLRRAQRRAIEEAGIYIESIFIDSEKSSDGRDIQSTALEIRTIAAAVTKTVILASRRAFEHDRPTFYVKYGRNWTSTMQQAVRRWKSDEQVQETHERQ